MRGLKFAKLGIIAVAMVVLATIAHALTFPQLTGRVVDQAGILDAQTRQALTDKLAAVETKTGQQIVVVTLKSLEGTSIEDYGYQLGRAWGIGQKDKNNGALLIVAPNERKVRIEVGYGLEGTLTDAISQLIIQNAILPRFRTGDFAGGITRGTDDIIQVASGDAEDYKQRAEQRPDAAPQIDLATILFVMFFLYVMFMMLRNARRGGQGLNRRGGYAGPIFIPSGGSWSSGSWGGGGGGGFSGGGGSFGGGGSSGSW